MSGMFGAPGLCNLWIGEHNGIEIRAFGRIGKWTAESNQFPGIKGKGDSRGDAIVNLYENAAALGMKIGQSSPC